MRQALRRDAAGSWRFGEFEEDAAEGLRVHESDAPAVCAEAWCLVDQLDALRNEGGHGVFEVGNGETKVMDPATAFGEEPGDRAVRGGGTEELDGGFAGLEESGAHLLLRNLFDGGGAGAEEERVETDRCLEIRDGDPHVVDLLDSFRHCGLHRGRSRHSR